jgi:hypothetical protein
MAAAFTCFLFDNGSFRADSTLALRMVADRLATRLGFEIHPVSLLHSTRIPAGELGGEKARLLEPALDGWFAVNPSGKALLLPLFFGPSGALLDYVPERVAALHAKHATVRTLLAAPLVVAGEAPVELAAILADRVREVLRDRRWVRPKVVLCDHGSPLRAVTAVRDQLGGMLADALAGEIAECGVASMERRDGDAYAFNEPLLVKRLHSPPFSTGEVVIALQFLSPGRHAGAGGDVALICGEAEKAAAGALSTAMTRPITDDLRLVELLARRAEDALTEWGASPTVRWRSLAGS